MGRFDRPGTYRLSVISQRVADRQPGGRESQPLQLASNELVLEIVPADPAWQKSELNRARTIIAQHVLAVPPPIEDDARTAALKTLRYLGTPNAAREMARLFRSDDNNTKLECMFGLVGSPSRADGLKEMKQLLAAPDFPVNETFLSTMALLSLDPEASPQQQPSRREDNLNQLAEELLRALPQKTGVALAISTDTALSLKHGQLPPDMRQKISEQIVPLFELLPIEAKTKWLETRWDQVKGPEWLPLLQKIASEYTDFPIPNETHAYQSLELSAAALTDWYQLDRIGARQAVITEIERPKPRFSAATLGILPDSVLPEAEQLIAEHFINTTDSYAEAKLAALLVRYADRDVLPSAQIWGKRSHGRWQAAKVGLPMKNSYGRLKP